MDSLLRSCNALGMMKRKVAIYTSARELNTVQKLEASELWSSMWLTFETCSQA